MNTPTEILFVRQRHEAKRAGLHNDYRVVIGDKAFSWASKKDFPEKGKPHILWEQPVHHASYLNNPDITIPDGQYGAGRQVIDYAQKGTATVEKDAYHLDLNNGERFLIKKAPDHYGDKAWLFMRKSELKSGNPYLEKAAELKRNPGDGAREVLAAGAGAHFVSKAPSKLLGYHNMYHGTSKENAKDILKNGLRKAHGGSRGAKVGNDAERAHFVNAAKKHVYMTKNKMVARTFAGDSAKFINQYGVHDPRAAQGAIVDGIKNGKVLKARVSHNQYHKGFKMDPDSFTVFDRMAHPEETLKQRAARSKADIGAHQFSGGKGSKGIRSFLTKNNLKRYYGSASGRSRAAIGAAQLVGGSALVAGAAAHHNLSGGHFAKERK